jgi:hypothetical protein
MIVLTIRHWKTLSNHAFQWLIEWAQRHQGESPGANQDSLTWVAWPIFPRLKKLQLIHDQHHPCAIGSSPLHAFLEEAPQLRHVHFWCHALIHPGVIRPLTQPCRQLGSLSLSSFQYHQDQDWIDLMLGIHSSIRYLQISHAVGITDDGVMQFEGQFPLLQVVVLHAATHITDVGIAHFIQRCPRLETIKFLDCPNISLGIMQKVRLFSPSS